MFHHFLGHPLPMFNRKLAMAVLIVAGAGVAFGAAVVLLLGQAVL